jgi:hypothetical protein
MSSHSYKFLCMYCEARLEGDWQHEIEFEQPCLGCGLSMDMIYHMFPNGETWMIKEYLESIDD